MPRITSLQDENRKLLASKEFSAKALVKSFEEYEKTYGYSIAEPEKFWARKKRVGKT